MRISLHHMRLHLIITLLSCSPLLSNEPTNTTDQPTTKSKNLLPALEILPTDSILKKITIPRYNKDYTPSSLLTADRFKIISDSEIRGSNVRISLYDEAGNIQTSSKLQSVSYNQTNGLLTSKENITFSGVDFSLSAQGVIIDWENHCGFLLGKNQTMIYLKKAESMKINTKQTDQTIKDSDIRPSLASKTKSLAVAGAVAAATSTPSLLSAQDLAQLDKLSQPSTQLFIQQLDETKATLAAEAEAEAQIAAIRKELIDKIGKLPKVNPELPAPAELLPEKGKDFINIKSDHLLFDAKKGVFVYYGNVRIKHPKYSFTCDGELKIILKETAKAKKLTAEQRAKLKPNDIFDDVSQIIATKNVVVRGKDNKGKDVSAVTPNLSLNKTTGDIILKGQGSRITTAEGQLKVVTKNGYIKLDQDFNASGQGTDTDISIPKNTINH